MQCEKIKNEIGNYKKLKEEVELKHNRMVLINDALYVLKTRGDSEQQQELITRLSESFQDCNSQVESEMKELQHTKTVLGDYKQELKFSLANMFSVYSSLHKVLEIEDVDMSFLPTQPVVFESTVQLHPVSIDTSADGTWLGADRGTDILKVPDVL